MYKPVIGLEIHTELKTKSKMFCSCLNDSAEKTPNKNICPICTGHPGTLPVINEEAVRKVIKTGLALNCRVAEFSKLDRKNYFYPDLPKGYQISQYDKPLCKDGNIIIDGNQIRIRRVHLEEDTGRLFHPQGENFSLIDFNRSGVPLMELVTEPDIVSGKEARKFGQELQLIFRYLDVSEADMERGQMRVEVNISLMKDDATEFGTKVEIKNLNSFRAVEKAVDYEIARQTDILEKGERVTQETRGWNDDKGVTISQREKEEAHDYRYFPEPDLPELHFDDKEELAKINSEIPELPQERRARMKKEYGISDGEADLYAVNKDLGEYFEKTVSELPSNLKPEELAKMIKTASNYLITELQGFLKGAPFVETEIKITPENFAEFIMMILEGKLSSKMAKEVLRQMFEIGADPSQIIEEKEMVQITDETEIENIIKDVISKNTKSVDDYKKGKANAFQFLVGQVMAATKGKANPETTREILKKLLEE